MKKYTGFPKTDLVVEELLSINSMHEQGGEWLGAARTWMQSNVPRGDTLTWGSNQPVTIPFGSLERLALKVANAAVQEDRRRMKGPGTPTARFKALIEALEERFPHPNPFDSTKAPEEYMLEAIDALLNRPTGLSQGWIPYNDGHQLPPSDAMVVYKMLDGDVELEPRMVSTLDWSRSTFRPGDHWEIIAYKVVSK